MKSSQYIRDAARVHKAVEITADRAVVAKQRVKMHIPARFPQRDLAVFEEEIVTVGICAIILDDKYYMTGMICAPIRTEPSSINTVVVDDVEYIEMTYEPGDKVLSTLDLVKIDNLLYRIYDELQAKARIPWYMSYEDQGSLFDTAARHAGVRVGRTPATMEIITATINRNPSELREYYRQIVETKEDFETNPPTAVPLRNVSYGATNTIAKITGSRFDEGMTSAIINPGERVERTEKILRT